MAELTRNLTLLTDFYELTMANGYFESGYEDVVCVFDMFFRRVPDGGGFAVAAGLEQLIEQLDNLHFTEDDIEFLRGKGIFSEAFLNYLRNFKFTCNVWAVYEGTPVFPGEPMVTVEGPAIQAQLIETLLLLTINYQTLVATKTNRIKRAAQGRTVMEFGARRAQSYDAAIYGARAAYIGGADVTSNVIADRIFGIPAVGTMAHSWIQLFDDEYTAFKKYAELYPDNCTFLVDTYNTLKSGVPNAIKVANEVLKPLGHNMKAIRIDSGDIAYLSKKARKMLDDAGFAQCGIVASNSLDEYLVRDLILQGAQITSFGIGENLITAKSDPVFGGVYKLVAIKENGDYTPKIKISETIEKITTPHLKKLYRLFDKESGNAIADYVTVHDEIIDDTKPLTIFNPVQTWKKRTLTNYKAVNILKPIYVNGEKVYKSPPLVDIKAYCEAQMNTMWDEVLRFENPHEYYVDLSQKLWDTKQALIAEHTK